MTRGQQQAPQAGAPPTAIHTPRKAGSVANRFGSDGDVIHTCRSPATAPPPPGVAIPGSCCGAPALAGAQAALREDVQQAGAIAGLVPLLWRFTVFTGAVPAPPPHAPTEGATVVHCRPCYHPAA